MKIQKIEKRAFVMALMLLVLVAPVAFAQSGAYDWAQAGVPLHASYPGVIRAYVAVNSPRLMKINCLRIDMHEATLRLLTTGRKTNWVDGSSETMTKRTRDFVSESQSGNRKVVAAINASPWNLTNAGASVAANLTGLAVSRGTLVSSWQANYPSFVVMSNGVPAIIKPSSAPGAMKSAVTGFSQVLSNGAVLGNTSTLHPRTVIGVSEDARYVFFMTVDGRATMWSQGATENEVGAWLKHFGAYNGINMDGGGSTTMAWWNPASGGSAQLLNVPRANVISTGNPPTAEERYNGNNIGVFYVAQPVMQSLELGSNFTATLRWSSKPDYTYTLWRTTNLATGFTVRQTGIPGGSSVGTYTDAMGVAAAMFWKVELEE